MISQEENESIQIRLSPSPTARPTISSLATSSGRKISPACAAFAKPVQEDQYGGPIADRIKEHLCTSDAGVIALRRRLLKAARDWQAGREPSEPHCSAAYRMHPIAKLMRHDVSFDPVARSSQQAAAGE